MGWSGVSAYLVSYSLDAFNWQYVFDIYGNQRVSINTGKPLVDVNSNPSDNTQTDDLVFIVSAC